MSAAPLVVCLRRMLSASFRGPKPAKRAKGTRNDYWGELRRLSEPLLVQHGREAHQAANLQIRIISAGHSGAPRSGEPGIHEHRWCIMDTTVFMDSGSL